MNSGFAPPGPITSPQAAAADRARIEQRLRRLEEGHLIAEEARGLYLRAPNGKFFQVTVTNAGALDLVDVGTVRP